MRIKTKVANNFCNEKAIHMNASNQQLTKSLIGSTSKLVSFIPPILLIFFVLKGIILIMLYLSQSGTVITTLRSCGLRFIGA